MRELAEELYDSKSFEYTARDFAKAFSKKKLDKEACIHYLEKFLEVLAPKMGKVDPKASNKNRTPPLGTVAPQMPAIAINADVQELSKGEIEKFRAEAIEQRTRENTEEFQARFVKEELIPKLNNKATVAEYYRTEDGFKYLRIPLEWEGRGMPQDNWDEALRKLRLGKLNQVRVVGSTHLDLQLI